MFLRNHELRTTIFAICMLAPKLVVGAGTWTPLVHQTPSLSPNGNPTLMLLLSDGTVFVQNDPTGGGGSNWFRLTPDIHGSYVNGTWTTLAPMHYTRAGCSSVVLSNGQVFVAGGEYGTGGATAEVYNPVSNAWTLAPVPSSLLNPTNQSPIWGTGVTQSFGDSISEILGNGKVLIAPVAVAYANETVLYDPVANAFSAGPNLESSSQSEASWVKLPDGSILTIDPSSTNSERYIPSSNRWLSDAHVPVELYDGIGELGAGFLLPNGLAIFLGGSGHTALYAPTGNSTAGTWTTGPDFPMVGTNVQGCPDAPAAMMPNGKILCSTGVAGTFNGPIYFFEYNYVSNSFTQVNGPTGLSFSAAPYYTKMLVLPDGTVLWNWGNPQLYSYKPDGSPLASGKPIIQQVIGNPDGSYHLVGTGLNGISEGAAYGDDAQMDSNYPLVRLTSGANVYYARTYNWSSTGVMTSNLTVTTEFALPAGLPAGTYSLAAVANGISSDPAPFTIPLTPPLIKSLSFSGTDLILSCSNGLAGRTYHLLTSADVTMPRSQWPVVTSETLSANGAFAITATNASNNGHAQGYFTIQAQ
jgi:hypothetical protein